MSIENLIVELQRRRVFRALIGYGIAAFAILQIIEPIMHGLRWPEAVLSYVVVALAIGFPIVISLAWIFDVNAGRIEPTGPAAPATGLRGARLAVLLVGIGVLAAAPGTIWYFAVRKIAKPAAVSTTTTASSPVEQQTAATPSIAVLPFVDMSPGKDQEYFSDGIAEEILNALAQVEGLQVTGRTSSFSFKGKNEDLRSIGQKLGVVAVLEGSVRKAANRVRVTAQVVKVADGFHLWSQTYDRDLTDIFAVQDEIARAVVAALRVRLVPGREPSTKEYRTQNPEAYRLYLLGRHTARGNSKEANRRSLEYLEQAVALEPSYAPAHADLFTAHRDAGNYVATRVEVAGHVRLAMAEAEKAVELAPDLAYALSTRGFARIAYARDWSGARSDLSRALELSPGEPSAHRRMGILLSSLGRLPEGMAELRKATELDPLAFASWAWLGRAAAASGDLDAARDAASRALSAAPEGDDAPRLLADIALLRGQAAEALLLAARLPREPDRLSVEALAAYDLGREQQSRDALAALIAKHAAGYADAIAEVHAWRGERDQAFRWLDAAVESGADVGFWAKNEPLLRKLHGDPRFTAFLKKLNLPLD